MVTFSDIINFKYESQDVDNDIRHLLTTGEFKPAYENLVREFLSVEIANCKQHVDDENFCLNINYLSSYEKAFLLEYFENIGKTEKGSQLEFLKKAEERLSTFYKNAIELDKKYKTLYIKLGFLIGLIIFILTTSFCFKKTYYKSKIKINLQ